MDRQTIGILFIVILFLGFFITILHQYEQARKARNNFEKRRKSINSQSPKRIGDCANKVASPKIPKQDKLIAENCREKHLSREYQHKHKHNFHEVNKFNPKSESDYIFIDTETSSLDNPYILDIAILDIHGSILLSSKIRYSGYITEQAKKVHNIQTTDLACHPYPNEIEDDLYKILRNKTVIAYNIEFDLKALKATFTSKKMAALIEQIEKNCICMMKATQELFRFRQRQTLINVTAQFELEQLPAHNAKNDALMLVKLYSKIKPLLPIKNSWMLGFEDIHWKNLHQPAGTELSFWSSQDQERQALYSPKSILGSEKVAELDTKLKVKLDTFGQATFSVSHICGIPNISIHTLSVKEAKENNLYDAQQLHEEYITELLNPKMPTKGKLRLRLSLNCKDANLKRVPKLEEIQIYKPCVSVGSILHLPSLNYSDNFNFRDVQFLDSTGQSCGHLLNSNKSWTRVFGILMKGYRADIHVLEVSKGLKVDVFFHKT